MKIAVIGANGQLGSDFVEVLSQKGLIIFGLNHSQIQISDQKLVFSVLKNLGPLDYVINTAAMHNVPECENNPSKAFEVNAIGARNLSLAANDLRFKLIHISTDYIFDGKKQSPYIESDLPVPLNVYGNTKLSGEYFIQSIADHYYILRVSGIYGKKPCRAKGNNFVLLMLKFASEKDQVRVVDDEILTPTSTKEIALQVYHMIIHRAKYGIYHITAQGQCSWYEFCKKIFELKDVRIPLNKANPGEFDSAVKRPKYSVLKNQNLIAQDLNIMSTWADGLSEFLKDL